MHIRRWLLVATLWLVACGGGKPIARYTAGDPNAPAQMRWAFDGASGGALPAGMMAHYGTWGVRAEAGAPSSPNALCQTGKATFAVLALSDVAYADVSLTVQFKPIAGQEDQAAGLIVRAQDQDNYYVLRANALENNVNLYKTVNGQRSVLKEGQATVTNGQWQDLRLTVQGSRLQGFIGGQLVVETTDDTFKAGKVGLWTKADSVSCFDEVVAMRP